MIPQYLETVKYDLLNGSYLVQKKYNIYFIIIKL
jgi:hypothetical protein